MSNSLGIIAAVADDFNYLVQLRAYIAGAARRLREEASRVSAGTPQQHILPRYIKGPPLLYVGSERWYWK